MGGARQMADISDIYSFNRKILPPPFTGAGSSAALRLPSRTRLSSTKAVALFGLFFILVVVVIAYVEVFFSRRSNSRHEYPNPLGDMQTNKKEVGVDILPLLGR